MCRILLYFAGQGVINHGNSVITVMLIPVHLFNFLIRGKD